MKNHLTPKKPFKLIVFLVIAILTSKIQAQDLAYVDDGKGINPISLSEYQNIAINGIKRTDIEAVQGNVSQMKNLFGNDLITITSSDPNLSIDFKSTNKGVYFSFEDGSDTGNNYELTYYTIFSEQSTLTVKGKTVKIGDNISLLGDVNINNNNGTISFITLNESSYIEIKFDKTNKTITRITYEVFT
jgi:hypothetical protein